MAQQKRQGICGLASRAGRTLTLSLAHGGTSTADAAVCGNPPVASDPGDRCVPQSSSHPKAE